MDLGRVLGGGGGGVAFGDSNIARALWKILLGFLLMLGDSLRVCALLLLLKLPEVDLKSTGFEVGVRGLSSIEGRGD